METETVEVEIVWRHIGEKWRELPPQYIRHLLFRAAGWDCGVCGKE